RTFDLALYPLLPGAFNAARSVNKALEHDQFGAATLAPAVWLAAHGLRAGRDPIAAPDTAAGWVDAILALDADPARLRRVAASARRLIRARFAPEVQRARWDGLLGQRDCAGLQG